MEKNVMKEAVPERQSQIPVQLSNLRDVSIELSTAVSELVKRLIPVCTELDDIVGPKDSEIPLVPLAYEIKICHDSILNSYLKIVKVLDNLEL